VQLHVGRSELRLEVVAICSDPAGRAFGLCQVLSGLSPSVAMPENLLGTAGALLAIAAGHRRPS
jgi:hypothetical protein